MQGSDAARADSLWERLVSGDRRALARAISWCESTRDDHRRLAETLVARAAALTEVEERARIGFTGPAGVGKSTLLDVLGEHLMDRGHRPAVLAVDPSSRRTGGSLLGDQTRMTRLLRRGAFVRPSPTRGHLGGAGAHTLEAALLCAAARFEPILIETVGVGQNESEVSNLVDLVVLLLQPGAGDEIQGMKRGVLEHADVFVVTQADGERRQLAEETQSRFQGALRLIHGADGAAVGLVSSQEGRGVAELWTQIEERLSRDKATGAWSERRTRQRIEWYRSGLFSELLRMLESDPRNRRLIDEMERAVASGQRAVPDAVRIVMSTLAGKLQSP